MSKGKIRIGITHGDINGISYEIILNTLLDQGITDAYIPIIYGSAKASAYYRKALNINININTIRNIDEVNSKKINLINVVDEIVKVDIGKSTDIAGEAAFIALDQAVKDLKAGKIDVLVTAPINKHNIQNEKFKFKGHTDFLQHHFGGSGKALMFMVSDMIKIALVSDHLAIKEVAGNITKEIIQSKLQVLSKTLLEDFGIRHPRIAVLGLNPHCGDKGVIGTEDDEIIAPAVKQAREKHILAFGPYAADGFFGAGQYRKFDAVLAMYHDQGLIPFKTITMEEGVNYSAGLPIIRTSPAHGTAYELAGKGEASCSSFRNALYLACDIFNKRQEYKEISANPLKSAALNLSGPDLNVYEIEARM